MFWVTEYPIHTPLPLPVKTNSTPGHLKSEQPKSLLPCYGTQEYGRDIIPNVIQTAMDFRYDNDWK